jgi:hypothetical protein
MTITDKHFDFTDCLLTNLDLSNNTSLEILRCGNGGFMEIDLSNNGALTSLLIANFRHYQLGPES